jgi:hypothetical protein
VEALGFPDMLIKLSSLHDVTSRDNAVSIASRYGLDVMWVSSAGGGGGGIDILNLFRPFLGVTQPPKQCVPGRSWL